jgi:hypothetical protein
MLLLLLLLLLLSVVHAHAPHRQGTKYLVNIAR